MEYSGTEHYTREIFFINEQQIPAITRAYRVVIKERHSDRTIVSATVSGIQLSTDLSRFIVDKLEEYKTRQEEFDKAERQAAFWEL